jgi:hypothetical protein
MDSVSNSRSDRRIASVLADYADGIAPLDTLLAQYQVSYSEIADLVALSDLLSSKLAAVSPSAAFVEGLYADLASGRPVQAWYNRLLPESLHLYPMSNRMMIAAGIGGITLAFLTARSLSGRFGLRHREETSREALA